MSILERKGVSNHGEWLYSIHGKWLTDTLTYGVMF